jgi:hypothetical protein
MSSAWCWLWLPGGDCLNMEQVAFIRHQADDSVMVWFVGSREYFSRYTDADAAAILAWVPGGRRSGAETKGQAE